ncbi:MAG: DegT/DnrJ/EryC1/StrS family aminotransferase [Halioglobus sp.]
MEKPFEEPLYVTRPFLPPIDQFTEGLKDIWESQWLTNNGPMLQKFEKELAKIHQTENISVFSNGTLALQLGLQALELTGEVITTPFTFVATTHALFWNKLRPVFCDIEADHYTLDPEKVEKAITPWTTAILAVHVFGYPCKLKELEHIARKHNLKLIYDAAHAFGVEVDGQPIGTFGDFSMFSFHATKLFHALEGGMLVFNEPAYKTTLKYLKNFGFKNETEVVMPGTNAKMNELQALMGLTVLGYLDQIIEKRRQLTEVYCEKLSKIDGITPPRIPDKNVRYNYSYLAIEIDEPLFGISRDALYEKLKEFNIYSRRYFYPLISDLACYRAVPVDDDLTVARDVASRILTLPIYNELTVAEVIKVCSIIAEIGSSK